MTSGPFYKTPTLIDLDEEEEKTPLPSQIGGYKVESLLSKGGMSVLYLAIHPQTHEPLTIKVLSSKYLAHPEMMERFMKEAEIIELTNHPNIVKLYGHGRWEGGLYIAMEFIQGISLRQMILQQSLSLRRALEIVIQIAHALTHLHAHGIIHRDLKPENVLLTSLGGVKVIDFGIAALYSEKHQGAKKRLMGTPIYMSPEQREDPLNVSFATDIYSLGIITYELVLGRLSHGIVHLALMPKGLQKILSRALQPKVEDRYEDIVDFIRDISTYLTSDEIKRDMRGSDFLGELSENLKVAQGMLVAANLPSWPRVELALASNSNTAISSVYYDFFQQRDGVYNVVLAESLSTGVEGLLHVAMLRGMIRALIPLIQNPVELVSSLNARLIEENHGQHFSLSFLTLSPPEHLLTYISCGYSPLWYIPGGSETARRLTADNVEIGQGAMPNVIEVKSNWNVGDNLVLHTFQAGLSKKIADLQQDEDLFLDALKESVFLAPKQQVETIFRKVATQNEKALFARPVTVISLTRLS